MTVAVFSSTLQGLRTPVSHDGLERRLTLSVSQVTLLALPLTPSPDCAREGKARSTRGPMTDNICMTRGASRRPTSLERGGVLPLCSPSTLSTSSTPSTPSLHSDGRPIMAKG